MHINEYLILLFNKEILSNFHELYTPDLLHLILPKPWY